MRCQESKTTYGAHLVREKVLRKLGDLTLTCATPVHMQLLRGTRYSMHLTAFSPWQTTLRRLKTSSKTCRRGLPNEKSIVEEPLEPWSGESSWMRARQVRTARRCFEQSRVQGRGSLAKRAGGS